MAQQQRSQNIMARLFSARKGQMALIFLMLIIVGLIFYAMAANWARLSQVRTQVSMAATTGAASLVSSMGSYGEKLLQGSTLHGRREKCDNNGFLKALLSAVLVIILILVVVLTGGLGSGAVFFALAAIAAGAVVMQVGGVIQAAEVESEITELWNKMMTETTSTETKFLEGGYQAALGMAVTDQGKVTDTYDFNMNGETTDKISRYAYAYSMRMWYMVDPKCKALQDMLVQMREVATNTLGIDMTTDCPAAGLAVTDPCCVPSGARSEDCSDEAVANCAATSYYPNHPMAYDPSFCGRENTDKLFGFIGIDDWAKKSRKNEANAIYTGQNTDDVTKAFVGFDAETVEGTDFTLTPFLWFLKDTVVNIHDIAQPGPRDPGCHWVLDATCVPKNPNHDYYWRDEHQIDNEEYTCNNGVRGWECFTGIMARDPMLRIDGVRNQLLTEPKDRCPASTMDVYDGVVETCKNMIDNDFEIRATLECLPGETDCVKGMWRPGADMFCDEGSYADCSGTMSLPCFADSSSTEPCGCAQLTGQVNNNDKKDAWNNDDIDAIAIQLRQLATAISPMMADEACATGNIEEWYADALEWIRQLKQMSCNLRVWDKTFEIWLEGDYSSEDSFCFDKTDFPPPDMSAGEKSAIEAGAARASGTNKDLGNLDSVIACLEWNSEDANVLNNHTDCWNGCSDACKTRSGEIRDVCKNIEHHREDLGVDEPTANCNLEESTAEEDYLEDHCEGEMVGGTWTPYCNPPSGGNCEDDCTLIDGTCYGDDDCVEDAKEAGERGKEDAKRDRDRCCDDEHTARVLKCDEEGVWDYPASCDYPDSRRCEASAQSFGKCSAGFNRTVVGYRTGFNAGGGGDPNTLFGEANLSDKYNEEGCSQKFVDTNFRAWQTAAKIQQPKFKKRADYLRKVKENTETHMSGKLSTMADDLDAGIVEFKRLMDELIAVANDNADSKPIVYAWKGEPAKGQSEGTWHIVKAHGGIPKKCGPVGGCGEKFPWIKTYKKGDFKRCYELQDTDGSVGMRVSRWDEKQKTPLTLANGLPLWNFTFGTTANFAGCGDLDACISCEDCMGGNPDGIFMSGGTAAAAASLADTGVEASSCGRYYLPPGASGLEYEITLHGC